VMKRQVHDCDSIEPRHTLHIRGPRILGYMKAERAWWRTLRSLSGTEPILSTTYSFFLGINVIMRRNVN